jgi:hypothetical protein
MILTKVIYRIIAIGDSITFGNCLPLENTYYKVLEEMLATKKIEDDYDAKFLQYADGCMSEGFIAFGVDSEAALQPLFETIISINKMEI